MLARLEIARLSGSGRRRIGTGAVANEVEFRAGGGGGDGFAGDGGEIGLHGLFAFLAAREGEIAVEHALHLVDVFLRGAGVVVLRGASASSSLRRASGVRRSWLTPASMAVRWSA